MMQVIACVIIGLSIATFVSFISRNETEPNHADIDAKRLEYKREGLVLHMPSYRNGIEVYTEPRFANWNGVLPILVKRI